MTIFTDTFTDTFADSNGIQLSAHTADTENIGWESGDDTTWTIQSNTANNAPSNGGDTVPAGSGEDFTTYSETDGPGKVTVTADVITLTDGDRNEDYYVTKELGEGTITDFTHWVDVNVTALTNDGNSSLWAWAISNADDDIDDIDIAGGDAISVIGSHGNATKYKIQLYSLDSGTPAIIDTSAHIAVGTKTYLAISRTGTTGTVAIYSTAALRIAGAAADVDTITGTVVGTAFRYVYGIASRNNGLSAKDISGTVSNLALNQYTENEIFATDDLGITEGIFDVGVTVPAITDGIVGLVLALDSKSSPANYLQVFYNRQTGKVELWKNVAGTYIPLINETATYSAAATLRAKLTASGSDLLADVTYDGNTIGTQRTISNAGIVGNTRHGIMNVDSSNSLDNFSVSIPSPAAGFEYQTIKNDYSFKTKIENYNFDTERK